MTAPPIGHEVATRDEDRATVPPAPPRRTSAVAASLIGSEILRLAGEIRALRATGASVCDLTVGDFDPRQFRIPPFLERRIVAALDRGETNYPPSVGLPALREAVAAMYGRELDMRVDAASVLVTGGSRPGIYAAYRALVDAGDRVVYPVPSWNNNHYCHLVGAVGVPVTCGAGAGFLPTRDDLIEVLDGARMIALNSPLNPAGTALDPEQLAGICDLVLEENARRERDGERPLFLLYDQVYWMLTAPGVAHVEPVGLRPEIAPYTIYIDGISKGFAATGVRVGWIVAPPDIAGPMTSLLGHIGAWAPRAEQAATAEMLGEATEFAAFRATLTRGVFDRLDRLAAGLHALGERWPVEYVAPQGAIYLSARFGLAGMRTAAGTVLRGDEDVRRFLLDEARLAVVPFSAFGMRGETGWFRLSVGATSPAEIDEMLPRLRAALDTLRTE